MKRNRIMSLVLAVGMIASCSCFEVSADSANPVMKVEAGTVIKTAGCNRYRRNRYSSESQAGKRTERVHSAACKTGRGGKQNI